jgi:NADPH:quinone reductase
MQAAFYVKQGPARKVLQVGEQPTPEPGPGEVRVHLKTSGVNPFDWKSRGGRTAPKEVRRAVGKGACCDIGSGSWREADNKPDWTRRIGILRSGCTI